MEPGSTQTLVPADAQSNEFLTADATPAQDFKIEEEVTPSDSGKPAVVLSRIEFRLAFIGLTLAVFVYSLDLTHSMYSPMNSMHWTKSIGLVQASFSLPLRSFLYLVKWQMYLVIRKTPLIRGLAYYWQELGSLLCGISRSINMLVISRAIAGVGGAGVFTLVMVIIADLTTPRERGAYLGLIGAVYGFASVISPIIGGIMIDSIGWRWVFYINLPIGAITVLTTIFFLKFPSTTLTEIHANFHKLDIVGSFLVVVFMICCLVPLQGGGVNFPWNSPAIIALFLLATVFHTLFLIWEANWAPNPIIPFALLRNVHASATYVSVFFSGACFYVHTFYLSLWFQVVMGSSATNAGVHSIPFVFGTVVASIGSGNVATATGYFFPFLPLGAVLTALGSGLMITMTETATMAQQIGYMFIAGLGIGSAFQMLMVSAQVSVTPDLLAASVST